MFIAAFAAPVSPFAHGFLPWYLPLGIVATLNAVHFFIALAVYSLAFGLEQFVALRKVAATVRRS